MKILKYFLFFFVVSAAQAKIDEAEVARLKDPDLYVRFNLDAKVEGAKIKSAYRKMVRRYHPDSPDCDPAHKDGELFKKLGEAYAILGDSQERAAYDRFRQQPSFNPAARDDSTATQDSKLQSAQEEFEILTRMKEQYPEMAPYIEGVLEQHVLPRIQRPGIHFHKDIPVLWPSDMRMVQIMLAEGSRSLIAHIAFCILKVPGWERYPEILDALLSHPQADPRLLSALAESFYHSQWVSDNGAYFLHKFLDMGFTHSVYRSLIFAGSLVNGPSWMENSYGTGLMIRILQEAHGEPTVLNLTHFLATDFDNPNAPWTKVLSALPEAKRAKAKPEFFEDFRRIFANTEVKRPPMYKSSCELRARDQAPAPLLLPGKKAATRSRKKKQAP